MLAASFASAPARAAQLTPPARAGIGKWASETVDIVLYVTDRQPVSSRYCAVRIFPTLSLTAHCRQSLPIRGVPIYMAQSEGKQRRASGSAPGNRQDTEKKKEKKLPKRKCTASHHAAARYEYRYSTVHSAAEPKGRSSHPCPACLILHIQYEYPRYQQGKREKTGRANPLPCHTCTSAPHRTVRGTFKGSPRTPPYHQPPERLAICCLCCSTPPWQSQPHPLWQPPASVRRQFLRPRRRARTAGGRCAPSSGRRRCTRGSARVWSRLLTETNGRLWLGGTCRRRCSQE